MKLLPKEFGLPARTVLEKMDNNIIAIVIDRKSRVIMTDGKKIVEKSKMIKGVRPSVQVALKTTAPVCSKTAALLESEDIVLILS